MHLRPKPWTQDELNSCGFFLEPPFDYKGKWQTVFKQQQPLYLELGCGKGTFIAQKAFLHPEINWLGMDMIGTVLGHAQRNARKLYGDRPIDNLRLTAYDISRLENVMSAEDQVDRIYINFCNPWPRHKHHKKRLTHPRQLEKYKMILKPGAQIHFKTDDDHLFQDSLEYFAESGFETIYLNEDLHADPWEENICTEHELMFSAQGIKIKAGIFLMRNS